jgi:hypothetical protein
MSWRPPEPDPLVELTDRAALRDAVAARGRERERHERAVEVATWQGTLRDLAERGEHVVLRTAGDLLHRGVLLAVGIDHVAVRADDGTIVLLAADTLRSVRPEPGRLAPVAMGDRERSQDRTLIETLARVMEDEPELVLGLRETADPVAGTIIGLGEDVITVRMSGGDRPTAYVPVTAIREIVIPGWLGVPGTARLSGDTPA